MNAHWLNKDCRYHTSESHDNASNFRRRMLERARAAVQAPAVRQDVPKAYAEMIAAHRRRQAGQQ